MSWRETVRRIQNWLMHTRAPSKQWVRRSDGGSAKLIDSSGPDSSSQAWRISERRGNWRRRVLLHKGERRHTSMIERADAGWLTVLDPDGMVILCYGSNTAATHADALDRHVAQFYAPQSIADVLARDHLRAAAAGSAGLATGWRRCPLGTVFWAVTTIEPLFLRDGRVQGFIHVIRCADGPAASAHALQIGKPIHPPVRYSVMPAGASNACGQLHHALF